MKKRGISEGGTPISDFLEMSEVLIKKVFYSQLILKKLLTLLITFSIEWIKILLNNQESRVINGGKTSKYFKLERETRQGDPISAYLFIIVLEVVFRIIKETSNIEGS